MKYLIIPHLRAVHINLVQNSVVVTPHSLSSIFLFLHALGRETGFFPERFAVVHHDAYLDADRFPKVASQDGAPSLTDYSSWQRRAAQLIDTKDIAKQAKSAGKIDLSLQPVITGNIEFTLVLEYTEGHPSTQQMEAFLETATFQGGRILDFGSVYAVEREEQILHRIRTGRWIVDRKDLLEKVADPLATLFDKLSDRFEALDTKPDPKDEEPDTVEAGDPSESTLDEKGTPQAAEAVRDTESEDSPEKKEEPDAPAPRKRFVYWSAATIGYALLSEPRIRKDARCSDAGPVPTAFAESLVGLVGLYSVHDPDITAIPFWKGGWPQNDVFAVQGSTFS